MVELKLEACCPTAATPNLARERAESLAAGMRALADPTRLQLLALLDAATDGEACVCDLTEPLGLSQPTISHHLKKLTEAGLVSSSKRGTWVWYSLNREALAELTNFFEPAAAK